MSNEQLVKDFIAAYSSVDEVVINHCLDSNWVFYATTKEGGVSRLDGAEAFVQNCRDIDVASVAPQLNITQITSFGDQVMCMVEVHAAKGDLTLHNFSAFLFTIKENKIVEGRMVEALPAPSDAFWAA